MLGHLNLLLLIILLVSALWTVLTRSLIRSAIGLALTSAVLAVIIFRLGSPLAAVCELSVCAGLIPVLFVSTISLTHPRTQAEKLEHRRGRLKRFIFLPFVALGLGLFLSLMKLPLNIPSPLAQRVYDVREVIWNMRSLDLIGQVIIFLAGVFGVVILLKEIKSHE